MVGSPEERAPWQVLAYIPVSLIWMVVYPLKEGFGFSPGRFVFWGMVYIAIGYGMYRRSRGVYVLALFLIAWQVFGVVNSLRADLAGGLVDVAAVGLDVYLLLNRATRAWCSWPLLSPRAHQDQRVSPDPRRYDVNRALSEDAARAERPWYGF